MTKIRGFEVFSSYSAENVTLPTRKTENSAGYDICVPKNYRRIIRPRETLLVPTGLTAYMQPGEMLGLFIRSGIALSNIVTLMNAVGVVDSDYYGKHIQLIIHNHSSLPFQIDYGDRIAQGIFLPYLITDDDDQHEKATREGGFGSTGR